MRLAHSVRVRFTVPAIMLLVACSGVPSMPEPDAGPPDAGPCEPRACGALECGELDDGCGGRLSCGCPDGTVCGFSTPSVCGSECATDADCAVGSVCDLASAACTAGCRTGPHIAVDIPLVRVALDVTLDGAPLPALRAGVESPRLTFYPLAERSLGGDAYLYLRATGSEPRRPVVSLAPGAYEVYLGTGALAEPPWPFGHGQPLGVVTIEQDTVSVPIDIVTHEITFRFTMDGAPLPDDFVEGTPELGLVPSFGHPANWIPLGDGGPVNERTLRVVAQTVSVVFDRFGASPATWPASGVVIDALDIGGASVVDIDIPRERLTVTLTRGGGPPPEGVELAIYSESDLRNLSLGPLVGGTASAWVLPGQYEVRSIAGPADWPQGVWTLAELTVSGDTTVDLDARPLLVHTTSRLDTDLASDCSHGTIELAGASLPLGAGGASEEADVWVFPGTFSPIYHPPDRMRCPVDGVWPISRFVLAPIAIVDASPITFVVPRAHATFRVRVDGSPPLPAISADRWWAPVVWVEYEDDNVRESFRVDLYDFDGEMMHQPVVAPAITLVPQTYRIYLRGTETGPSGQWPFGRRLMEDAFVLESDTEIPLEVETTLVRIDLSLNGGPLPDNARDSWGGGGIPAGIELRGARATMRLVPWDARIPQPQSFELRVFPDPHWDLRYNLDYGFSVNAEGPLPVPGIQLGCWEP